MIAAGTGGAGANPELSGELGVAGGGKYRGFLMTDGNPFDLASPDRIGQRIERIADQSEDVFDADLFERADQLARNCL
jgi:hypothetical protein